MDDTRSHCHEASLYKSHGRRKGTVYGYLLIAEGQIVVAWRVANVGGLPNTVIGSPREKVAAFSNAGSARFITCSCSIPSTANY
jgi:hypothetical protein